MRILILGAGATGGYFGARLAAAGVDVTFLVRPVRAATLAKDGLVVDSPLGNLNLKVKTATTAMSGYDAVIVSCKAYDLNTAIAAIAPAVSGGALVLPLLNGLAHLDALDRRFGAAKILGGLCHIGVTLTPSGAVKHLNDIQRFALGPRQPSQIEGVSALHAVLAKGGFSPALASDISQQMWEKFVLLTSYAGMTCLMRAPVGVIAETDAGPMLMNQILTECAAVATAAGYPPGQRFLTETLGMLTERGSTNTSSMLRDVAAGARTEHEHVLGDMIARGANINLPLLRIAHAHMQAYDHMRGV